jgi:hypothetical protein
MLLGDGSNDLMLKNLPDERSEPGDIFFIQMITGRGTFNGAGNPARVSENFKVL